MEAKEGDENEEGGNKGRKIQGEYIIGQKDNDHNETKNEVKID